MGTENLNIRSGKHERIGESVNFKIAAIVRIDFYDNSLFHELDRNSVCSLAAPLEFQIFAFVRSTAAAASLSYPNCRPYDRVVFLSIYIAIVFGTKSL